MSTGATVKGAKGPPASKTGTTAASNSASHPETGRKVTPEKITKWLVDTASAVVDRIPAIKPGESQLGSVGTTYRACSLPGLPWSSKRAGNEPGFCFPGDFNEALDNDDAILAADVGTQADSAVDTIHEELVNDAEQDQADNLNVGSTVEIKDPSPSSPIDSSWMTLTQIVVRKRSSPTLRERDSLMLRARTNRLGIWTNRVKGGSKLSIRKIKRISKCKKRLDDSQRQPSRDS